MKKHEERYRGMLSYAMINKNLMYNFKLKESRKII